MTPQPTLRILAVEANQNINLPQILNVANIENKTFIILVESGEDSSETTLVEYQDGFDVAQMRNLQAIGGGE